MVIIHSLKFELGVPSFLSSPALIRLDSFCHTSFCLAAGAFSLQVLVLKHSYCCPVALAFYVPRNSSLIQFYLQFSIPHKVVKILCSQTHLILQCFYFFFSLIFSYPNSFLPIVQLLSVYPKSILPTVLFYLFMPLFYYTPYNTASVSASHRVCSTVPQLLSKEPPPVYSMLDLA